MLCTIFHAINFRWAEYTARSATFTCENRFAKLQCRRSTQPVLPSGNRYKANIFNHKFNQ